MKKMFCPKILIVASWVLGTLVPLVRGQTYSEHAYNLKQALLVGSSYSNTIRPDSLTHIQVRFNLLTVNGLDTRGQSLSTTGWLTVKWLDPRLTWTPATYGNIEHVFDTEQVLWRPELVVDNAVDSVGVIEDDDLLLRVTSAGEVIWEPPGIYTTSCDIDVTFYPFDRQTCSIEVTSWAYTITEVNLTNLADSVYLGDYSINGEWDLLSTEVSRKTLVESEGTYSQLDFTIKMQRRVTYYVLNVVLPIFLTSFLSVFTFILPPESGEKVSYALTVLLSYAVLMLLVSDTIPPTSIHVSALGLYLALVLFFGVISTIMAVVVLELYHRPPDSPVSTPAKIFITKFLVPVSSWQKGDKARKTSSQVKIAPADDKAPQNEDSGDSESQKEEPSSFYPWTEIAHIVDKAGFRISLALIIILNIMFFITFLAGSQIG